MRPITAHDTSQPPLFGRVNEWGSPRPTLDLRLMDGILPSNITFTRASNATRFNAAGLLVTESSNVPRFDCNPANGSLKGLLVEEARTNYTLYSRNLTQAAWAKTTATATLNQVGIDGASNTASLFTATGVNAIKQTITLTSNTVIASAYIKRVSGSGTVEFTQDNGTTWTPLTLTTNWQRFTLTAQTLTNPTVGFRLGTSGNSIAIDAAQLEIGSIATSVITTTSASVTRATDVISCATSSFGYNASEGTWVVEASFPSLAIGQRGMLLVWNGTSFSGGGGHILRNGATPSGFVVEQRDTAGVDQGSTSVNSVFTADTPARVAYRYKLNDSLALGNAGTGVADTSVSLSTNVSEIRLGRASASTANFINGHMRRVIYYPVALTAGRLQSLTE